MKRDRSSFDFLIVGAGPAGIYAAMHLGRRGFRVLLIEKKKSLQRKICGEYICPSGVQRLVDDGLGKIPGLFRRKIKGMRITSPGGVELNAYFSADRKTYGCAVKRGSFESLILNECDNTFTETIFGCRANQITPAPNGHRIKLGIGETVSAHILVGADGILSPTAEHLQLRMPPKMDRIALHTTSRLGEYGYADKACMKLLPNGSYLGLNPLENELNITFVMDLALFRRFKNVGVAYDYLVEAACEPVLSLENLTQPIRKLIPLGSRVENVVAYRAALLGDAAGFLDPLTGEGITAGLVGGYLLSAAFGDAQTARMSDDDFVRQALRKYVTLRNRYFAQKAVVNRLFQLIIRSPQSADMLGRYLNRRIDRKRLFLGIISNTQPPFRAAMKMIFPAWS